MEQLRSAIAGFMKPEPGRRQESMWLHGASEAGSTWLDRLTDLLLIFRRPVPVPVRTRRRF
jgi:hypothetical protein